MEYKDKMRMGRNMKEKIGEKMNQKMNTPAGQDLSGAVKPIQNKNPDAFLGKHPSNTEPKTKRAGKPRLKPTYEGSVPGPGSHKPKPV